MHKPQNDPQCDFPASHEAVQKLKAYEQLLREWNAKFNLIAPSTVPQIWQRHFQDSAQLWPLLPPTTKRLVDLGSGAGFPGLVLAIMGVPEVHLIESTGKKARFLETVATELGLCVTVHNERIEAVSGLKADVVTARALTALPDLFKLARPFLGKESVALFLKGEKAEGELTQAHKYWTFECVKTPSATSPSGVILQIRALKAQRPHDGKRRKQL